MKKLLFLISFYLLISPLFGQTSKPPIFVIPPKIKGELSEIQIKFLLITLDDLCQVFLIFLLLLKIKVANV
tara:strand:+ start:397 stop:609 length:213 start_codon:yes stop_codon:yes gene_type:complete